MAHTTIRYGSRGTEVAEWQRIIAVKDDGIFGPLTDTKTRVWQTAHGLTSDGIVGPKTWQASIVESVEQAPMPPPPPPPAHTQVPEERKATMDDPIPQKQVSEQIADKQKELPHLRSKNHPPTGQHGHRRPPKHPKKPHFHPKDAHASQKATGTDKKTWGPQKARPIFDKNSGIGTVGGAAAGAMVAGPVGAVIGAGVGWLLGRNIKA